MDCSSLCGFGLVLWYSIAFFLVILSIWSYPCKDIPIILRTFVIRRKTMVLIASLAYGIPMRQSHVCKTRKRKLDEMLCLCLSLKKDIANWSHFPCAFQGYISTLNNIMSINKHDKKLPISKPICRRCWSDKHLELIPVIGSNKSHSWSQGWSFEAWPDPRPKPYSNYRLRKWLLTLPSHTLV